ncbi:MAG: hypothetical protein AB7U75_20915 [Hyphomicrobiaceae bacterium]
MSAQSITRSDLPGRDFLEAISAELVLQGPTCSDGSEIAAIAAAGKLQSVAVLNSLPALLLVWTVDPSFDGGAHFHKSIFGRDAALFMALYKKFGPVGWCLHE